MPALHESVCCREIDEANSKREESDRFVNCIVDHPGFNGVCLDPWVLQTAFYSVRQHHGANHISGQVGPSQHE